MEQGFNEKQVKHIENFEEFIKELYEEGFFRNELESDLSFNTFLGSLTSMAGAYFERDEPMPFVLLVKELQIFCREIIDLEKDRIGNRT